MSEQAYYAVIATQEPDILARFQANVAEGDERAKQMLPQNRIATRAEIQTVRDYYAMLYAWFTQNWTYDADSWAASGFGELKRQLDAYLKDVGEVIAIYDQTLANSGKADKEIKEYLQKRDDEHQTDLLAMQKAQLEFNQKMIDEWNQRSR